MSRRNRVAILGATLILAGVAAGVPALSVLFDDGRSGPSAERVGAGAEQEAVSGGCGVERWAVKTLDDDSAALVSFSPRPSTVARLAALPAPRPEPTDRTAAESVVYRIKARLDYAKIEADGDIHLAVSDPRTGDPMIVELPASYCHGAGHPAIDRARRAYVAACGTPSRSRFASLSGVAWIRGVLFFDRIHGQRGVAPNGIELHPVLGFRLLSPCR